MQSTSQKPEGEAVYVLRAGEYHQIGQSEDVDRYVDQLARQLPFGVELVYTIEADDVESVKTWLQRRFADKLVRHEWYALDETDVAWIGHWARENHKLRAGAAIGDSAEEQPMSRRERLKQERERRILEAAATVFARKGFHQATIHEIAELAGVADGTIYNYFANKRDLLVAMTRHVVADSASAALQKYEVEDDRDFLIAIFSERFEFGQRNFAFVRAMMSEVWTNEEFREQYLGDVIEPLLQLMEGYLQSRVEAGTVRPVNTSIVVRAMLGSFLIFLMLAKSPDEALGMGMSAEELARELADFCLFGLQIRPRREEAA